MSLTKREYTDGVTVITAQNLNDIQDEIINNGEGIGTHSSQIAMLNLHAKQIYNWRAYNTIQEAMTANRSLFTENGSYMFMAVLSGGSPFSCILSISDDNSFWILLTVMYKYHVVLYNSEDSGVTWRESANQLFPIPYNASTTYALGDITVDEGVLYKSLYNSNVGHKPNSSPTYWQQVRIGNVGTLSYTVVSTF